MHQESRKRKIPLFGILAALLFVLFATVVLVFLATASVTGSATLPNGSNIGITTKGLGFGVTSDKKETRIEAGGYVVEIDDKLTLMVNGAEVTTLDGQPQNYDLVVDAEGLRITSADRIVAQVK